jgi:hypothetical protein
MRPFVVALGLVLLLGGGFLAAVLSTAARCAAISSSVVGVSCVGGRVVFLFAVGVTLTGVIVTVAGHFSRSRDEITEEVLRNLPRGPAGGA